MKFWIDHFACEGGASKGYQDGLSSADITVIGTDQWYDYNVDRYPFPHISGDSVNIIRRLAMGETHRTD